MEIKKLKHVLSVRNATTTSCDPDGGWNCNPDYCLPDSYNTCNPEAEEAFGDDLDCLPD